MSNKNLSPVIFSATKRRVLSDREAQINFHLSEREHEVLSLLAAGFIHKAIGEKLGIKKTTVETYLERAQRALGAETSYQAVAIARKKGLIEIPVQKYSRSPKVKLSDRQKSILSGYYNGKSDYEICRTLGCGEATLNSAATLLKNKLCKANPSLSKPSGRMQIVNRALELGMMKVNHQTCATPPPEISSTMILAPANRLENAPAYDT